MKHYTYKIAARNKNAHKTKNSVLQTYTRSQKIVQTLTSQQKNSTYRNHKLQSKKIAQILTSTKSYRNYKPLQPINCPNLDSYVKKIYTLVLLLSFLAFPLKTYAQEAWCWGDNLYGQIGDGTAIDRHRPVHVSQDLNGNPFGDVVKNSAGWYHTCALKVFFTAPPDKPTDLWVEGQTSPQSVSDPSPEFSAVNQGQTANRYQIQVATDSGFSSIVWNSGEQSTLCSAGERCPDITYSGPYLSWNTCSVANIISAIRSKLAG